MFWVNFVTLSVTLTLEETTSNNPLLIVVVGDFNLKHNNWWDIKGRAWGGWTSKTETHAFHFLKDQFSID